MKEVFCASGSCVNHCRDARPERMVIRDDAQSLWLAGMISVNMDVDQSRGNQQVGRIYRCVCQTRINIRRNTGDVFTNQRDIHHLILLLRQGNVRAAQEYRERLDTLSGDVRSHLSLASGVLADLRPRRQRADAAKHSAT